MVELIVSRLRDLSRLMCRCSADIANQTFCNGSTTHNAGNVSQLIPHYGSYTLGVEITGPNYTILISEWFAYKNYSYISISHFVSSVSSFPQWIGQLLSLYLIHNYHLNGQSDAATYNRNIVHHNKIKFKKSIYSKFDIKYDILFQSSLVYRNGTIHRTFNQWISLVFISSGVQRHITPCFIMRLKNFGTIPSKHFYQTLIQDFCPHIPIDSPVSK